ncbi:hypothetical protein BaRGS_00033913, partial [Batillaria attramentaria]
MASNHICSRAATGRAVGGGDLHALPPDSWSGLTSDVVVTTFTSNRCRNSKTKIDNYF